MHSNPLYKFLKQHKFWNWGDGHPSHLFLDNGKAFVPEHMLNTFNNMYANMIVKGKDQFVVEQKTSVFKFFVDLDISTKQVLSQETLDSVILEICSKTISFFEVPSEAIVCTRDVQEKSDGTFKTGIHLYFPSICTDSRDSLNFRVQLVSHCNKVFPGLLPWGTTIDSSVYKANGIRMIGSKKKLESNVYMPSMVWSEGVLTPIENPLDDFKEWIRRTSVRHFGPKSSVVEVDDDESDEEVCYMKQKNPNIHPVPKTKLAQSFPKIFDLLPSQYRNTKVTGLYHIKEAKSEQYIIRTNSKFCLNKGGFHSSSNVYFMVNKNQKCIYQKCYCTKLTCEGRKQGYCGDFSGPKIPLTPQLVSDIFGVPVVNNMKTCLPLAWTPQPIMLKI